MSKTIKYNGLQDRWPELAITGKQSVWRRGQQEERSDAEAGLLIATTLFTEVATVAVTGTPDQAAAFPALVSGAGISHAAAVAKTPGTAGEKRTLSDGPNKGVGVVWSMPSGKTSYAWCWQIYPLAAYP